MCLTPRKVEHQCIRTISDDGADASCTFEARKGSRFAITFKPEATSVYEVLNAVRNAGIGIKDISTEDPTWETCSSLLRTAILTHKLRRERRLSAD